MRGSLGTRLTNVCVSVCMCTSTCSACLHAKALSLLCTFMCRLKLILAVGSNYKCLEGLQERIIHSVISSDTKGKLVLIKCMCNTIFPRRFGSYSSIRGVASIGLSGLEPPPPPPPLCLPTERALARGVGRASFASLSPRR